MNLRSRILASFAIVLVVMMGLGVYSIVPAKNQDDEDFEEF